MRHFFLRAFFTLILLSPLQAEITADNALDFLMFDDLHIGVHVTIGDIDWIEDQRAAAAQIDRLKTAIATNAGDLQATFELIDLYNRHNKDSEAEALANRTLSAFEESFNREPEEANAVRFAKVAFAARARDRYDTAYRALQPYLESGRAKQETCFTAIENRKGRDDYGLAKRIAEHYLKIYPDCAELHYQLFDLSIWGNLQSTIIEIARDTAESFLDEQNKLHIDTSNVQEFVDLYFGNLRSKIDSASLMKAIELEPSNYEYNLYAAIFKVMTHFFSKVFIQSFSKDVEEESIEKILKQADPGLLEDLRSILKRAEENRPKRDIQVYLCYAMVSMALGLFDQIEPYALIAIGLRPDLPGGYDALILSTLVPYFETDSDPDPQTNERAIEIYKAKMKNVGENASDCVDIARLYFSNYIQTPSEGSALKKAKIYLEKALEIDAQFVEGLVILASFHIVMGEYPQAVRILTGIPEPDDPHMKAMVINNRGIARILNGERETGVSDLRKAAAFEYPETLDALQELGLD
jgi:hypothetical protein